MVRENLIDKSPASGRIAWLLACCAATVLPACSAAPAMTEGGASGAAASAGTSAACNARAVQDLVGQYASALIAEGARQRAGAARARMIGHDEMVTKEYDPGRLNLQMNSQGRVAQIYCG